MASNDDAKTLTYQDSGYHGLITYKVAAFNNQTEKDSNIAVADVDPADCPLSDLPFFDIKLVKFLNQTPTDQAYCYVSLGGLHWYRWPETGFFNPSAEDFNLSSKTILSLLASQSLADEEPAPDILSLDCWGWFGNSVAFLGNLQLDGLNDPVPGNFEIFNGSLAVILKISMPHTMDGEFDGFPLSSFLLQPVVGASKDEDTCDKLAPNDDDCKDDGFDAQTPWVYDPTYLIWGLYQKKLCQGGENCIDPTNSSTWGDDPAIINGEFGYNIYVQEYGMLLASISDPDQFAFNIPGWITDPQHCNKKLHFKVKSYLIPEGSQQMFESPGTWFAAATPCPKADVAILEITVEDVIIGFVDPEEPEEGEFLEFFGEIKLNSYYQDRLFFGGAYSSPPGSCPEPDGILLEEQEQYNFACPLRGSGPDGGFFNFSEIYMCLYDKYTTGGCKFYQNNNTLTFYKVDSYDLVVDIEIYDKDYLSNSDIVCWGKLKLPNLAAEQYQDQGYGDNTFTSNLGSCLVNTHLKLVGIIKNTP